MIMYLSPVTLFCSQFDFSDDQRPSAARRSARPRPASSGPRRSCRPSRSCARRRPACTRWASSTRAPAGWPRRRRAARCRAAWPGSSSSAASGSRARARSRRRAAPGSNSGSVHTVFSSTAPIVFVYVAFSTSTVLPIGGTTPVHLSGLRSPAQTTSKIFSKLWPLLRPALDDLDAVEVAGGRVLHRPHHERRRLALGRRQVAAHRHAFRVAGLHPVGVREQIGGVYSQPPNRRTLMCGPLTAKVSLRCMASKSDARVFSSAHTPVRPAVLSVRASKMPPTSCRTCAPRACRR